MTRREPVHANGILFLYHRPVSRYFADASNVNENIAAFSRHSRFGVWHLNVDTGLPPGLPEMSFDAVFIHYSVFATGEHPYPFSEAFLDYLAGSDGYLIANFQDEHQYCRQRDAFLQRVGPDCIYTLLEPDQAARVYGEIRSRPRLVSHLPGYVGPELLAAAERHRRPDAERHVDIGYRTRPMRPYFGRGGMEKSEIGERFDAHASKTGLGIDISVSEEDRLYGEDWPEFISDCRAVLGTESGVSCFDLEDEVRSDYERLQAELGREPSVEELERSGPLARWDWKIPYRTISPRHFEAAALEVCQILYPGRYSGAMEPMRHYIPLEKDFSNFDEVIERFRDAEVRRELTENARRDLIESGEYSYERLIARFDEVLADAGLDPSGAEPVPVGRALRRPLLFRARYYFPYIWAWLWDNHRVTWTILHVLTRPVALPLRWWRRWRRRRAGAAATP